MKKYLNLGKKLFPICRSITGNGVRKTLIIIREYLPKLKIFEVKSGTKVFDWKVPPEWNVTYAYVLDKNGLEYYNAIPTENGNKIINKTQKNN